MERSEWSGQRHCTAKQTRAVYGKRVVMAGWIGQRELKGSV